MPTKQRCNVCGELKVLKDFPLAQKVHGVQRYKHTCILCAKAKSKQKYKEAKEELEELNVVPNNKIEPTDYKKGYKICSKCGIEKPVEEFFKDRISNGRQTYRADCKLCSQADAKQRIARYRSKKKVLASSLTNEEWQEAVEHWNGHCAYCGTGMAECQEHCVPVDKGGSYAADNIVPACLKCNSSKGNRHLKFWWKQQPFFTQEALDKVEKWLDSKKNPEL